MCASQNQNSDSKTSNIFENYDAQDLTEKFNRAFIQNLQASTINSGGNRKFVNRKLRYSKPGFLQNVQIECQKVHYNNIDANNLITSFGAENQMINSLNSNSLSNTPTSTLSRQSSRKRPKNSSVVSPVPSFGEVSLNGSYNLSYSSACPLTNSDQEIEEEEDQMGCSTRTLTAENTNHNHSLYNKNNYSSPKSLKINQARPISVEPILKSPSHNNPNANNSSVFAPPPSPNVGSPLFKRNYNKTHSSAGQVSPDPEMDDTEENNNNTNNELLDPLVFDDITNNIHQMYGITHRNSDVQAISKILKETNLQNQERSNHDTNNSLQNNFNNLTNNNFTNKTKLIINKDSSFTSSAYGSESSGGGLFGFAQANNNFQNTNNYNNNNHRHLLEIDENNMADEMNEIVIPDKKSRIDL